MHKTSYFNPGTTDPLTFARFAPLPENRSALAAAQRVASCVGSRQTHRAVNPLYLHGPPGTGKTCLVSSLVAEVTRRCADLPASLLTAGDLARTEEAGTLQAAHQSDLVIVEDLQHLPRQGAEALVQLFDYLHARQVQMVFTATCGPRQLDLPARLTSRLACGLVVGMEPWGPASRLAILQDKAQRLQLAVSRDVLAWLAEHLSGGRQLEGALTRLQTLARMQRQPLDVAQVADHFREQAEADQPTVERIVQRVSGHYRVEPGQLQSQSRGRHVLLPRQVSMYLVRQLTRLSLEQIGAYFGGRDHSTVLHACRKVELGLEHDAILSGSVRQLQAELA